MCSFFSATKVRITIGKWDKSVGKIGSFDFALVSACAVGGKGKCAAAREF